MCVITLVEFGRPTDDQVGLMWDQNPKGGGGVAYRAINDVGREVVRWEKGLSRKEMLDRNRELPMPYVLHFRQPSTDTSQSPLAAHPFQIDDEATSGFSGETEGFVLFHNGFWTGWRMKLEQMAIAGHVKLPSGAWSDSRGLAWAAHHLGFGFLEMVNEKVLAFGPGELDIEMFGGPWQEVAVPETPKGIVVSNRTWERSSGSMGFTTTDRRHNAQESTTKLLDAASAIVTGKKTEESGGTPHERTFRRQDGAAAGGSGGQENQQEQVQKAAQGTQRGDVGSSPRGPNSSLTKTCTGCGKRTESGTLITGMFFCWQCWATNQNEKSPRRGEWDWIGCCQTCKVSHSAMKRADDDSWICMTCWETNGRPQILFARQAG